MKPKNRWKLWLFLGCRRPPPTMPHFWCWQEGGRSPVAGSAHARLLLLKFGSLLAALVSTSIASADIQINDECTPTKTVQLDLPEFNWRDAEKQDRDRYGSLGRREYSVAEIESMITRPSTVTQLLQNFKIAVDRDLLAQRHFFETSVMKKFFSASSVHWSSEKRLGRPIINVRAGVVSSAQGPFDGYQIKVRLVRDEILPADADAYHRHPDHFFRHGTIDLDLHTEEHWGPPVTVKSVVQIFRPPPLSMRQSCAEGAQTDPGCKGRMVYEYREREIVGVLGVNKTEFELRKDGVERFFLGWDRRTPEGRQRFLCDEDELRSISVDQR